MGRMLTYAAAERLFLVVSSGVLIGWLVLIIAPRRRVALQIATMIVPGALCTAYVLLAVTQFPGASGGFGSLAAVASLFQTPGVLLAGWIHYLAFDLLIGTWEVRDAVRAGVPHRLVVPCLVLTFSLGPAGLLAYVVVRSIWTRYRPIAISSAE